MFFFFEPNAKFKLLLDSKEFAPASAASKAPKNITVDVSLREMAKVQQDNITLLKKHRQYHVNQKGDVI